MSHFIRTRFKTIPVETSWEPTAGIRHVRIGDYFISLQDFLVAAYYILTNVDVATDDPRLAFVRTMKTMKLVPGFNSGGERLKGESWAVDAFVRHDDVQLRE